ncbi:formate/nitrite transporter family protein [Salipaludibacillus sp. LMS25]|jgi:nitrite transporter NirC|uniref:formate/nitrite transporter family protein n=1 Tax=Salipaludibacillus sp. LMS25 TaxID=2924031 RepID=UPI0020D028AC|nr:formate/nitrite transporter family protein [Salipaludibacillus sp. LMS25]UTR14049.1 formate/nitrite transporter family protein [Salipaludibacillus sp. LMS25]
MEMTSLEKVEQLALKKEKIFKSGIPRYLLRAILASMFIGFGVIVAFKTGSFFYTEAPPWTYPMAAITFGSAIILIAYGGGDLFTGNTFYFTYTALRGKMKWSRVLTLWGYTYLGNIIGAVFFAFLIFTTGLFTSPDVNAFLLSVVEKKMTDPTTELFFRAILCNWLICLAFFLPMSMKEDIAKIMTMILFVFCFFISGYEHSIANMCTFAIAFVLNPPDAVSIQGMIYNLVPVTIGNIIGGSVLMAGVYYYINKPFLKDN